MNNLEFKLDDAIDVIEEVIENGGEFRLFPKGFSMRPLIVQGRDSVVLRRNKTCPAAKHDIAFYRRDDGQFVLHRVMKIGKDGLYTMCGDGQYVYEQGIRKEQIIAYVSDIYKTLNTLSFAKANVLGVVVNDYEAREKFSNRADRYKYYSYCYDSTMETEQKTE